jgi:tRNA threonylcarbamoyladenosine biosynthesis protein TsaE
MSAGIQLDSSAAMMAAGGRLAQAICAGGIDSLVIYLSGDLGAGKTTFVRGFLQGLGHTGRVPSPTYTLIEPYDVAGYAISHIDLYRLQSPGEAETLALAELYGSGMLMLIEWPENGGSGVPAADLRVELDIDGPGRVMHLVGLSAAGKALALQNN